MREDDPFQRFRDELKALAQSASDPGRDEMGKPVCQQTGR